MPTANKKTVAPATLPLPEQLRELAVKLTSTDAAAAKVVIEAADALDKDQVVKLKKLVEYYRGKSDVAEKALVDFLTV